MLVLVTLTGCLDGSDGGGDTGTPAPTPGAPAWEGGEQDNYPVLADGSPDVEALQVQVPAVKAVLDRAGHDASRLARPEIDRQAAAQNAVEASTGLPAPRQFAPLYTQIGLDCDVPAFHSDRYDVFDDAAESIMSDWGIMTATLAVSNECATFYDQGYGVMGPWFMRNAPPQWIPILGPATPDDALVRVASVVKPITAAAIHVMDEEGTLSKSDRAFCVPGGPANCILDVDLPPNFDDRIGDITVGQLVLHDGGFDRDQTTDYLFLAWAAYQALGLSAPPTPEDFAEYMLRFGVDYEPGKPEQAGDAYSNLGYLILGMIIEEASGMSYMDYIHTKIMAPLSIAPEDVVLSASRRIDRDPREVGYWCISNTWGGNEPISTFPGDTGQKRCWANGGWVLESMMAHGGLSMTAEAVATFYAHWWNFGNPRDEAPGDYWAFPNPDATAYTHSGRLASVQTIAARCTNGLNIAFLTNQHAWAQFDFGDATDRLCAAADDFLAQGPYYSVLWVNDSPAGWVSHRGTHEDQYQARFDELRGDGLRPNDVNGYAAFGDTYYSHTWINDGTGTDWAATHGHNGAGFITKFEELSDDGYRLHRISCWNDSGTLRYASVWHKSDGAGWFGYIGLTATEYQQKFDDHGAAGYRLVTVDGCESDGQSRYAAAWVYDATEVRGTHIANTPYRGIHGATAQQYQAFFDDGVEDGFRLTDIDVWTVGGQSRYAAVMTQDGGPGFIHHSKWSFYDFQPKWQELVDDGWRLASTAGWGPSP